MTLSGVDTDEQRIGYVDIFSYLAPVVEKFGAEEHPTGRYVFDASSLITRLNNNYLRDEPVLAPVFYENLEPKIPNVIPQIKVIFDSSETDRTRVHDSSPHLVQPAKGTNLVSVGGNLVPRLVEVRGQEEPTDLEFTFVVKCRSKALALAIIQRIKAKYKLFSFIDVIDSEGNSRRYQTETTTGIQDISEVASTVERYGIFSLAIKVNGELSVGVDQVVVPMATGGQGTTPNASTDPDPGPSGVYGEGLPYPPTQSNLDQDGDGVDDFTIELTQFIDEC